MNNNKRVAEITNDIWNYKPTLFEKILWPIKRFFKDTIPDIPYKIKYFIQRGHRGWSDEDRWNMDSYLISIILPMLKELKKKTHSYPGDLTEEKWDKLLDEMIIGFEAANRVIEDDYYKEVSGDSIEDIHNAPKEEIREWGRRSMADQKLFHKKMKIFNKYFFSLWD